MDLERLYLKLPVPLQEAALQVEGLRIRRWRFNKNFRRFLAEYQERAFWTPAAISSFRDARLAAFVRHAGETSPYYREYFRKAGIRPEQIRRLEDLAALPVLRKSDVQESTERFASEAARDSVPCHTSGSTGAGLHFPATRDSQREHWACWWRYRAWHGIGLNTQCLILAGRSIVAPGQRTPPFWRRNRPMRQRLFSGYHLSTETAGDYLRAMRDSGAPWLHGYPSMVALLAGYALELGEHLKLQWVTLGAENVTPGQAAVIEEAFGVRPRAHYSLAEGVANISECPEGGLHVDEDFAAVEFLPVDGSICRIIGVNLSNPAFPLLRYDTGDLAVLSESRCACGRPGRVVERIDGRQEDFVVTRSGVRLGRMDHIFKDMTRIRAAQLRQDLSGFLEVWVVRGKDYNDADEARLRAEIEKRTADDLDYNIRYVEDIPRTSAGKLRFVVSSVPVNPK